MITAVTLRFALSQAELDLYTAAAAAEILATPRTRRGDWIFTVQCDDYDPGDDPIAANSSAWTYWTDTLRRDLRDLVTADELDRIEEALEIQVAEDDEHTSHELNLARALFAGRRAA